MSRPRALGAALVLIATLLTSAIVSSGSAAPAAAATTSRIAGNDRFETSVRISEQMAWTPGGTVFLASGLKFPDALSAGPVAAAEGAHLLLTAADHVPASVMGRLTTLAPAEVVLVGDESSISSGVAQQVEQSTGAVVTRIAGPDRLRTSVALLERLTGAACMEHVWVVAGGNFPDALVAGSIAGRDRGGILLAWHGSSPAAVLAWQQQIQPLVAGMHVRIAGSVASVSAAAETAIRDAGAASITRFAGSDRYDTARQIHDAYSASVASSTMLLATGQNFPDALSGSLLAAAHEQPLYLTPTLCHDAIAAMLRAERDQRSISTVIGLGGSPSLSELALHLEGCPPPPVQPEPQPQPQPQPQPPAGPAPAGSVNCSHFSSWAQAQAWFTYWYPTLGDVAGLDSDGDLIACEGLR